MMRRLLTALALCTALLGVAGTTAPASAEPPAPDKCFESGPDFELPTCTWDGSEWSVSYDPDNLGLDGGPGIPSGFVALFVLVAVAGVGLTIWRVSLARDMAREAGMDPDRATAVTLLSDDGLDATYLASSLRGRTDATPPVTSASRRPADERLRELRALRDEGLLTPEEYEARRKTILDSL